VVINVARGPVVDSEALAEALNTGRIAGAGIDVFEIEPPLDTAHPLLHAKNCVVTPHVAFASAESMNLRADIVFDNLNKFLAGEIANSVL
jgi:D-3-phosphoglycerate dehydrogenase